jgi:hypothetical protein
LTRVKNELHYSSPWELAPRLADKLDAVKLITLLPASAIKLNDRWVSSVTTAEAAELIEHVASDRQEGSRDSRFQYQVTRALKAASTFVALEPAKRRGHILGCGVREMAGEVLTVEGVGTMISDHTAVPIEPQSYGA